MQKQKKTLHFKQLIAGNEKALSYYYNRYFTLLVYRTAQSIKDRFSAETMAQDAFLRLWLNRQNMKSEEDVFLFLRMLMRAAKQSYFKNSKQQFQHRMLLLDQIVNYAEFLFTRMPGEEVTSSVTLSEEARKTRDAQLEQIRQFIPSLNPEQQEMIQLCMRYNFKYDEIARHIGGISDYQIAYKIEKLLAYLRRVFTAAEQMKKLDQSIKVRYEGDLNAQQAEIFQMRYEAKLSFEEIAKILAMNIATVKLQFIKAHAKRKKAVPVRIT